MASSNPSGSRSSRWTSRASSSDCAACRRRRRLPTRGRTISPLFALRWRRFWDERPLRAPGSTPPSTSSLLLAWNEQKALFISVSCVTGRRTPSAESRSTRRSSARAEALALLALDPSLAAADPASALYLDTETTGLSGSGTIAFLIGLAGFDDGELVMEQLLLRTPSEEAALLARVSERIEAASLLVTFNGKAFDVPTLNGRFVMNRLPRPPERPHFDLLHVARRLHKHRVGSCSLKAVESEVLGFVRDADIDGADVAPRYGHFLRTGDESVLVSVVEHNAWDVVSMAALVGLYGEPLAALHEEDLVGLARTFRRARAFWITRTVGGDRRPSRRGAGPEGLRVRGGDREGEGR